MPLPNILHSIIKTDRPSFKRDVFQESTAYEQKLVSTFGNTPYPNWRLLVITSS